MANHKSAAKRARQAEKRTLRNSAIHTRVKKTIRTFREALRKGDKQALQEALKTATVQLRRAASKGVLHPRNASRRVSRLVKAAAKAS